MACLSTGSCSIVTGGEMRNGYNYMLQALGSFRVAVSSCGSKRGLELPFRVSF